MVHHQGELFVFHLFLLLLLLLLLIIISLGKSLQCIDLFVEAEGRVKMGGMGWGGDDN